MSTTITHSPALSVRRGAVRWLLAAACLTIFVAGCSPPPQLGNEESLGAADALWTAVTSKRLELVESSAKRIEALHAQGTMSDEVFQSLTAVIETARAEKWPEARKALKHFVSGQRPAKRD